MMRNRCAVCLSAVMLLFAATASASEKPADPKKTAKPAVDVEIKSWQAFEKLVATHKGKIVVVDVWTTTCGACIEEFPHFVALRKQFPRKKVALISLNCDYDGIKDKPPEHYRPGVLKFLRKQNATFENVMLDVSLIDFLDLIELASTPAVLVYAPDGKLAKRFDNDDIVKVEDEFTIDDVKKKVEKLLAAESD